MEPEALEKAVGGSLAESDVKAVEGALHFSGSLPRTTLWVALSGALGAVALVTGGALALTGPDAAAGWTLAAGAVLLGQCLALFLVAVAVSARPDLEVRPADREVVRRGTVIPFTELRPEHLVLRRGVLYYLLQLRHPALRRHLATFSARGARQAEEFHRGLWELLARTDSLTPVQRWIIGAAAPYGAVNGFRLDRLGTAPAPDDAAADRRKAHELLQDPWGVDDLDQLLPALTWLVQEGHRADFAQDADLAVRPAAEREEYAQLLREVDDMIAHERMEPPFVERLVQLVRVRYGLAGEMYAKLVPSLLRDEPGADASPEGAELATFLNGMFNDRDHASEELHRLKLLAGDPALRANIGRFLIWDYSRALMLYRLGHMAGWLTDQYCWDRMLPLALDIQRRYGSWDDMATCYLQGRLLWSGGEFQGGHERLVEQLRTDPQSPWNQAAWDLTLKRDWS